MTRREINVFSAADTLAMQRAQYRHDKLNHGDIADLHKGERIKHYGLHFCKYVGRFARGDKESVSVERTVVDATLVCLSAANTLTQKLGEHSDYNSSWNCNADSLLCFADAAGRFADAAEKFDHLEDCLKIARTANADIFQWLTAYANSRGVNLLDGMERRRGELRIRAFYASE